MTWSTAFVFYLLSLMGLRDVDQPVHQVPPAVAGYSLGRTTDDEGGATHKAADCVLDISNGF